MSSKRTCRAKLVNIYYNFHFICFFFINLNTVTLQSDIGLSGAEKSALEQQIATLHLANERNERQAKQEITRLQAEIQSLRQRLDRADADLIHSRRENIRLSEQISSLEKEVHFY